MNRRLYNSEMANIKLDVRGRLVEFVAVPLKETSNAGL